MTLCFALVVALLAGAEASPEAPRDLAFDFSSRAIPDADRGQRDYFVGAVRRLGTTGEDRWRREVPDWMSRWPAMIGEVESRALSRGPLHPPLPPFLIGVVRLDRDLVLATPWGLLVLDAATGAERLSLPIESGGGARHFPGPGRARIRSGSAGCDTEVRSGGFVAPCGERLVYFNGETAVVLAVPGYRELARVRYDPALHSLPGRLAQYRERMLVGDVQLEIEGVILVL